MKAAMVALHERLREVGDGGAAIVLMIHDELVLEVQQDKLQQASGSRIKF